MLTKKFSLIYKYPGLFLSSFFIFFCFIISIFSYFFIPDNSEYSNQMHLPIHSKSPGFSVNIISIPNNSVDDKFHLSLFFGNKYPDQEVLIKDYKLTDYGIEYETYENNFEKQFISFNLFPSELSAIEIEDKYINKRSFLFGTDSFGRDVFGRVMLGTRVSLFIGLIAVFISLLIGLSVGLLSGYYGGLIDKISMMFINIFWSIPTLLLVIAISLALGKGFWQVYVAVGLTMWVEVARVVRGQVISEKNKDYIIAAKVLGFSDFRICFNHLIPNIIGPILIISAANFASAILIESGLSFLGIGTQPPMPSWGSMIKDNYQYIILGKAYLAIIPGIAIMLLVTSFMFLGNNLGDLFGRKN
ncbi:MAG: peptide transporter [Cryomorphaceae bacterium BACL29 MAG-121220-bin8]|jgi:peptide/nickel transport system permease protein|nr:MAG: peptide transporter [Cryomorphaceae bacterium BACL29 MAG-121220-bin8]|tara:strand:- start:29317 stop:30393 length:1077 start_codon:yes stop_codon:yes gene_type:complete